MVTEGTIWASGSCLGPVSECAEGKRSSCPFQFYPLSGRSASLAAAVRPCPGSPTPLTASFALGALRPFPRGLTGMDGVHSVLCEEQLPAALLPGPLCLEAVLPRVRRVSLSAASGHARAAARVPRNALATPACSRRGRRLARPRSASRPALPASYWPPS